MLARIIAVMAFAAALPGCFPFHFTVIPAVTGLVEDESTEEPLANVQVRLVTPNPDKKPGRFETTSGPNGRFHLAAQREWGLHVVLEENWSRRYLVRISAPGYETVTAEVEAKPVGAADAALGVIRLRKAADPTS
jgi:hypothetical protein